MPVGAKRLLPQSGNAIFHKGWPCVYGMIASNILFEALENAYCTAATPSCAEGMFCSYAIIM
jgi:hypothetical protein